jgi:hypothetical protein
MAKGGNGLCMSDYEAQRRGRRGNKRWSMDKQGWGRYGGTEKHENTAAEKAAARRVVPEDLWDMLDIREST